MNEHECAPPEELGAILNLEPSHPQRLAAEQCPACHATLLAYAEFQAASEDAESAYTAKTAAVLDRHRARLLRPAAPRRPRLFAPAMLPAWGFAAAAVVLLTLHVRAPMHEQAATLRGDRPQDVPALALAVDGSYDFRWPAQTGVDHYAVQILDANLQELTRWDAGTELELARTADQVAPWTAHTGPLFWRVVGLSGADIVYHSPLATLPVASSAER